MKHCWEIKKLGEVCENVSNINWKTISLDTKLPYIDLSAVDIDNSNIDDFEYINKDNAPSRAKQIVNTGDVIFATTRPLLKRVCVIIKSFNNAIASTGFCVLRPKGKVVSKWIYYILKSDSFYTYIEPLQKGISYPAVSDNEVKNYSIPVPPLAEQKKIVEELDCLSGIIEKKKQQLKEYDALAQSIFYEMFGNPDESQYPLQNISSLSLSKLSYGSGASAVEYDGKVRYVRITDIMEDGKLDKNAMSPNVFDDKYLLNDGDILFARSGATVGKTYHYKETDGVAIYAGYLIRFIPNKKIVIPEYIYYYTLSPYYQAFVRKNAQAVAQPNINAKQYGDLRVCVPPLALQQEFASKIEAIEKQKELIKQSIAETETLFNSRMDFYFN